MLYKAIDVWKRTGSGVIRYRCFETVTGGRYSVQSSDSYTEHSKADWLDRQYIDLLCEQAPDERAGTFLTIEEAIAAHDADFEELDA